jgi:putative transposase/transposase-like zinc-binding protein
VVNCLAPIGRPRFDIADIVRRHRSALETEYDLTLAQRRVLSAIELCRTVALGGHVDVCRSCGFERPAYNSCRNRHCPKCQSLAQEEWIAARAERLLPVQHFHVVFTIPSELRRLARYKPRIVFDALFRAAGETLLNLGRSHFHAEVGATLVLHTWTRELHYHPHVHAIVTAGGLALGANAWTESNTRYLFPVQIMGALLRGKMLDAIRRSFRDGAFDGFDDFRDPQGFDRLMTRLAKTRWVVYAKRPFRRARHVLEYLGRYTHRVGIANSRLLNVTGTAVSFKTKHGKSTTIAPLEFLRRFVEHVLPQRFVKIRHYGLYAAAHVETLLANAARLLEARTRSVRANPNRRLGWEEFLANLTGHDVHMCPNCGASLLRLVIAHCARDPPVAELVSS